jgi:release factor glutamine methyltransferase
MSLKDTIISALIEAHIPSPRLETEIILRHTAPLYPEYSQEEENAARDCLNRRIKHEPLDKIIGEREFYKATFKVTRNVLSPRPDTEILVENALALLPQNKDLTLLDLGTGSGCILLSLLKERPHIKGIGVDISSEALEVAKENAKCLGLCPQTEFICSSWKELSLQEESVDMVVSNPPYIPSGDIETLEDEVKNYDPLLALDGGKDGLDCYRELALIVPRFLKNNGYLLLEVGYNQAQDVKEIFEKSDFNCIKIAKDLSGIDRCVILKRG